MSTEGTMAFVMRAETEPELRREMEAARGSAEVLRIARARGFDVTGEELDRALELLRFLGDVQADPELRDVVAGAGPAEQVLAVAKERGYDFDADTLAHVHVEAVGGALDEDALEGVAGGTGVSSIESPRGLRVRVGQSVQRTSPNTEFSHVLGQGLSKGLDMSTGSGAAPFVPGASVITAAINRAASAGSS